MSEILTLEIAEQFLKDGRVRLEDYTSMDDAAAQALAQHKGDLSLEGLTSLSEAAAQALGKHEGGLWLAGLTSLSEAAAQALAQHEGFLSLRGLTSLSDAAAQALGKHKGYLYLNDKAKEAVERARKRLPQTAQSVVPSAATGTQLKDSATKPEGLERINEESSHQFIEMVRTRTCYSTLRRVNDIMSVIWRVLTAITSLMWTYIGIQRNEIWLWLLSIPVGVIVWILFIAAQQSASLLIDIADTLIEQNRKKNRA